MRRFRNQGFVLFLFLFFVLIDFNNGAKPDPFLAPFVSADGFREYGLNVHNKFRNSSNVTPLEMDQELNKLAHAHAELCATYDNMTASDSGFRQNLWAMRGELLPLAKDLYYAINCWYTGSRTPGRVESLIDQTTLKSNDVTHVGFGVGTRRTYHGGEGYTVVVAFYQ